LAGRRDRIGERVFVFILRECGQERARKRLSLPELTNHKTNTKNKTKQKKKQNLLTSLGDSIHSGQGPQGYA
jgi:hypothetical protein